MKTKDEVMSNFSEESLNEMAMENVEGGGGLSSDYNTTSCPVINNCSGGNCEFGCNAEPKKENEA